MSLEGNVQEGRTLAGKVVMLRPVDATLTKSGYAADAKVTGDALEELRTQIEELRTAVSGGE